MMPDLRFATLINRPPPAAMIASMAAELVRLNAIGSETDMIRALTGRFAYGEIVAFGDQALAEARRRAGSSQ